MIDRLGDPERFLAEGDRLVELAQLGEGPGQLARARAPRAGRQAEALGMKIACE